MNAIRSLATALLLAAAAVPAAAQSLKVLSAGAFKQVAVALVPAFEARTGTKVEVDSDTAGGLVRRVQGGESFDVLIVPPAGMETLVRAGKVEAASVQPVVRVGIGVAVKAGAPRPPLATAEQFKDAVLQAKRVAYIDPAAGGTSGIYLTDLFQRLGITDAVRAKAVLVPGGLVAERLVTGEADLAIHQVSEILPVRGAELVGPLPENIQSYTTYAAAVAAGTPRAALAKELVEAMTNAAAAAVLRAKGMMPASAPATAR